MNVVLIGRPGAGKGTQSQRLVAEFGLQHVATGEMLRAAKRAKMYGEDFAKCIDEGNLAADDLIMRLVGDRVRLGGPNGWLFDGVPRTVPQAEALEALLAEQGLEIDAVLEMTAPTEQLVERILKRAAIEGRADDTPETLRHRLKVYADSTAPILDYYHERGLLVSIDATGSQDEVFAAIKNVLQGISQTK